MTALRTEHKSMTFLVAPDSREAVLEVLHIMPRWAVREELGPEGLSLHFAYERNVD